MDVLETRMKALLIEHTQSIAKHAMLTEQLKAAEIAIYSINGAISVLSDCIKTIQDTKKGDGDINNG